MERGCVKKVPFQSTKPVSPSAGFVIHQGGGDQKSVSRLRVDLLAQTTDGAADGGRGGGANERQSERVAVRGTSIPSVTLPGAKNPARLITAEAPHTSRVHAANNE
jgi:hypothetical protein